MKTSPLRHVLITTVGQTIEPIISTVTYHAPDGVVFIASQETQHITGQVIKEFKQDVQAYTLLIDDPESLSDSYQVALKALEKSLSWEAQVITADLTGGTKPMVAGLALALTGQGVTFSYVGGKERDELGRVRTGTETVLVLEDPSSRYHLQEWRAFQRAWNGWRFQEAIDLVGRILDRPLSPSSQRFHRHLVGICKALVDWDRFQHREAFEKLSIHLEPAMGVAEAWRHGAKVRVLGELEKQILRLEDLVNSSGKPSPHLLTDLLANAQRRADVGRYDDALARLYRAVELTAETDVYQRHGIDLKHPDTWSSDLPKDLRQRASEVLGLKGTLVLAFDIDVHHGETGTLAQQLLSDYRTTLQLLLEKRNASILAHGFTPIQKQDYKTLLYYLTSLGIEAAPPFPRW